MKKDTRLIVTVENLALKAQKQLKELNQTLAELEQYEDVWFEFMNCDDIISTPDTLVIHKTWSM